MRLLHVPKAILRYDLLSGSDDDILSFWINQEIAVPGTNGAIAAIHSGAK
jgi:hypothetical protein